MARGKQKQTPDFDATLGTIDAEIARLTAKQAELATTRTTSAQAALDAEQEAAALSFRRDVGDETGLDDAIEAADAKADAARRAHRRAEHNQRAAEQRIGELAAERLRVKQDRGRALLAAAAPGPTDEMAKADRALADLVAAVQRHRDLRIQLLQIAADSELPEAEISRLHDFRFLARRIGWALGSVGLMQRPLSGRHLADIDLADLERQLLTGEAPVTDDADDEATAA